MRWTVSVLVLLAAACDSAGSDPARSPVTGVDASFSRRFVDITEESGIRFRHVTGGYGDKLMPETLGSGAAFLDYDGDGNLDIFLVNSRSWPGHQKPGARLARCALYRGNGDGTLVDVTLETGAGISLHGMGCCVGDPDGDGDPDIYVTAVGDNVLLLNDGGVFQDATRAAGVAGGRWGEDNPEWSTAATFLDIDNDGDLDLFVTNYVEWTPETEIFTTLEGVHKAFTTPDRYVGLPCRLFLNRGDATFEDVSERAGLLGHKGKSLGIALWDLDGNGFTDIVVANDTQPNFLFFNRGGGVLEEQGLRAGIAYDDTGRARAGMGIDIADYGNDGVPGVAIGNFSLEPMSLYRWQARGVFISHAEEAGLALRTFRPLAFAIKFLDLDLDGRQDLVVVNGHIEPDIARVEPEQSHAQPLQLFKGVAAGRFVDVSASAGADFQRPIVGRGLAAGDIDGDGDLDLLITTNGGTPVLLRNDSGSPGVRNHYLRVRVVEADGNRDSLGAVVTVRAGGITQTRRVGGGSSYLSESERILTFGLGSATHVEELRTRWPGGEERVTPVTEVDIAVTVKKS